MCNCNYQSEHSGPDWQYIILPSNCTPSCPIHVVTFTLISNLATDYIQKRRGEESGLFSFEYNLSPKLISNVKVTTWIGHDIDV